MKRIFLTLAAVALWMSATAQSVTGGGLTEENLKEMLTFANAAASLITTRKGALRVMPTRDEIQNLLGMK